MIRYQHQMEIERNSNCFNSDLFTVYIVCVCVCVLHWFSAEFSQFKHFSNTCLFCSLIDSPIYSNTFEFMTRISMKSLMICPMFLFRRILPLIDKIVCRCIGCRWLSTSKITIRSLDANSMALLHQLNHRPA